MTELVIIVLEQHSLEYLIQVQDEIILPDKLLSLA